MQTCRNIQGFLLVSAWGGLHALSPQGHTGCLSCTKTHSYNGPSPRRSAATRCVDFVRSVAVLCECATQNRRFFVFRTMTEFAELAKGTHPWFFLHCNGLLYRLIIIFPKTLQMSSRLVVMTPCGELLIHMDLHAPFGQVKKHNRTYNFE